jgi:hypothetical protein
MGVSHLTMSMKTMVYHKKIENIPPPIVIEDYDL